MASVYCEFSFYKDSFTLIKYVITRCDLVSRANFFSVVVFIVYDTSRGILAQRQNFSVSPTCSLVETLVMSMALKLLRNLLYNSGDIIWCSNRCSLKVI